MSGIGKVATFVMRADGAGWRCLRACAHVAGMGSACVVVFATAHSLSDELTFVSFLIRKVYALKLWVGVPGSWVCAFKGGSCTLHRIHLDLFSNHERVYLSAPHTSSSQTRLDF